MAFPGNIGFAPWMVPVAGALAGLLAGVVLSGLKPVLRIAAGIAAAVAVSAMLYGRAPAMASHQETAAFTDLPKAQQNYEQALFQKYPALKTLAEGEPGIWQETHRDIAEVLEIHAPDDPARPAALAAVFVRLHTKLLHGAASGGDAPLHAYLVQEDALTRSLQARDAHLCADRALGIGGAEENDADAPGFQAAQRALVDAYLDGGRTPVPPPDAAGAQVLMRHAVDPGTNPFSHAEQAQFIDRAQQPPEVACALTIKFYANLLAMPVPDSAALLRTLLRTR